METPSFGQRRAAGGQQAIGLICLLLGVAAVIRHRLNGIPLPAADGIVIGGYQVNLATLLIVFGGTFLLAGTAFRLGWRGRWWLQGIAALLAVVLMLLRRTAS